MPAILLLVFFLGQLVNAQPGASREPTVLLPNGKPFAFWDCTTNFNKTYYVDQANPKAADSNPGTRELPFRSINAAAQVAGPNERVEVAAGVYRETVHPDKGGAGPDGMVSYEAAPGQEVIITGSEVFTGTWQALNGFRHSKLDAAAPRVQLWEAALPAEWLRDYNPFAMANDLNSDDLDNYVGKPDAVSDPMFHVYLLRRGLVFQDGKRLAQTWSRAELRRSDGTYWVNVAGDHVIIHPFGEIDPSSARFEFAVRAQAFAPIKPGLPYIRVKGFTVEHCANGFLQPGAICTTRGDHWIIEGNTVRQVNSIGIDSGNQGSYAMGIGSLPNAGLGDIIRENTLEDCGMNGIWGFGNPRSDLVEDNLLRRCAWQNTGSNEEAAAIKFHVVRDCLFRRNLIVQTHIGPGIWLDWDNQNSRITQNICIDGESGFGSLFVEASRSKAYNMVDNNIVLDCKGPGIYSHNGDRLHVIHNLVSGASTIGIHLGWDDPEHFVATDNDLARGATGRKHVVIGNIVSACPVFLELDNPDNTSDYNAYVSSRGQEGPLHLRRPMVENLNLSTWQEFHDFDLHGAMADIEVDRGDGSLTVKTQTDLPIVPYSDIYSADIDGTALPEGGGVAGPFAALRPGRPVSISLDPRHRPSSAPVLASPTPATNR